MKALLPAMALACAVLFTSTTVHSHGSGEDDPQMKRLQEIILEELALQLHTGPRVPGPTLSYSTGVELHRAGDVMGRIFRHAVGELRNSMRDEGVEGHLTQNAVAAAEQKLQRLHTRIWKRLRAFGRGARELGIELLGDGTEMYSHHGLVFLLIWASFEAVEHSVDLAILAATGSPHMLAFPLCPAFLAAYAAYAGLVKTACRVVTDRNSPVGFLARMKRLPKILRAEWQFRFRLRQVHYPVLAMDGSQPLRELVLQRGLPPHRMQQNKMQKLFSRSVFFGDTYFLPGEDPKATGSSSLADDLDFIFSDGETGERHFRAHRLTLGLNMIKRIFRVRLNGLWSQGQTRFTRGAGRLYWELGKLGQVIEQIRLGLFSRIYFGGRNAREERLLRSAFREVLEIFEQLGPAIGQEHDPELISEIKRRIAAIQQILSFSRRLMPCEDALS